MSTVRQTYEQVDGQWRTLGVFRDDDLVSVAPFDAITIRLIEFEKGA